MAALPPAVLAHARPSALAAVLGSALPSSPPRDERSHGCRTGTTMAAKGRSQRMTITGPVTVPTVPDPSAVQASSWMRPPLVEPSAAGSAQTSWPSAIE